MNRDGQVKVYVEKPDDRDFFHNAVCWLSGFRWEEVRGFSQSELDRYDEVIRSVAHRIFSVSQNGNRDWVDDAEIFRPP